VTGSEPFSGTESYALLDLIPLGVAVLDSEMRVTYWNACLEDWTGVPRSEMLGADIRKRFRHLSEPRYMDRLRDIFRGGPPALFSSQLHPHLLPAPLASGRLRSLKTLAVPVPSPTGFDVLLAAQDVSDLADAMVALRAARAHAEHQAGTDALTGIPNRRDFFDTARKALAHARRHNHPCTLLMIDVDGLKTVNDRLGHAAGDELLLAMPGIFARSLRESDIVARLGGDEFAVLLLETEETAGAAAAERLRSAVNGELLTIDGVEVGMSISVGLASFTHDIADIESLLKRADAALYGAKRAGRNRVFPG